MIRILGPVLAAAMLAGGPAATDARAMGFCDCCATSPGKSCKVLCETVAPAAGQCLAIVDYKGRGGSKRGVNPLNGISLKDISLGEPGGGQLERFRRFLERSRRAAIRSQRRAIRSFERRRIDQAEFDKRSARYNEALVNYYHAIRAYLIRVGMKKD